MIRLFLFCFDLPNAFLLEGELTPAVTYDETFEIYIKEGGVGKERPNL